MVTLIYQVDLDPTEVALFGRVLDRAKNEGAYLHIELRREGEAPKTHTSTAGLYKPAAAMPLVGCTCGELSRIPYDHGFGCPVRIRGWRGTDSSDEPKRRGLFGRRQ